MGVQVEIGISWGILKKVRRSNNIEINAKGLKSSPNS